MAEEIAFNYPPTAEDPCSCGSRLCPDCQEAELGEWIGFSQRWYRFWLAYYRLKHRIFGRV